MKPGGRRTSGSGGQSDGLPGRPRWDGQAWARGGRRLCRGSQGASPGSPVGTLVSILPLWSVHSAGGGTVRHRAGQEPWETPRAEAVVRVGDAIARPAGHPGPSTWGLRAGSRSQRRLTLGWVGQAVLVHHSIRGQVRSQAVPFVAA